MLPCGKLNYDLPAGHTAGMVRGQTQRDGMTGPIERFSFLSLYEELLRELALYHSTLYKVRMNVLL